LFIDEYLKGHTEVGKELKGQVLLLQGIRSITKETAQITKDRADELSRINFENQQLDKLEMETINLEEKIIKTLSSHAKKQKK